MSFVPSVEGGHYLSALIQGAERLVPSKVASKVRAGWAWHRLSPGFGAAGGVASYSRALIAPDGTIAFVSDRADGLELLESLPVLKIGYRLVRLSVSFDDKECVKALGAVWVAHKKCWACAPECVALFQAWVQGEREEFDLLVD